VKKIRAMVCVCWGGFAVAMAATCGLAYDCRTAGLHWSGDAIRAPSDMYCFCLGYAWHDAALVGNGRDGDFCLGGRSGTAWLVPHDALSRARVLEIALDAAAVFLQL